MGGPGLTEAYVARLASLARAAGIDSQRLADEVADHLAEAVERYRLGGLEPGEAERRAVEGFGEAKAVIEAIASSAKGGSMSASIRRSTVAVALAATGTLLIVHVVPSQSVQGGPLELIAAAAMIVMGSAGLALIWSWRSTMAARGRTAMGWRALMLTSAAVLGALSAWEGSDLGFVVPQPVGGRLYLALIAALVLLVVAFAHLARAPSKGAGGLVVAGVLGLTLQGVWNGAWRPLGGIGDGQANMGITLLLVGWVVAAGAWLAGNRGRAARAMLGRWFVLVGERLAPNSPTG
jgi:hypothetical protein